jgi:hypothetical protein
MQLMFGKTDSKMIFYSLLTTQKMFKTTDNRSGGLATKELERILKETAVP